MNGRTNPMPPIRATHQPHLSLAHDLRHGRMGGGFVDNRRLAQQDATEGHPGIHLGVGQEPQLLQLLRGQQVRLVQDENDLLLSLGGLPPKACLGLRDERRLQIVRSLPKVWVIS